MNKSKFNKKKECPYKEEGQEYARVVRMLGDCRVSLECEDGIKRIGIIRGAIQKKVWIKPDDIVLIGLRDFQDEKADIIHKYEIEDVRRMRKEGHFSHQKKDVDGEEENPQDDIQIDFND